MKRSERRFSIGDEDEEDFTKLCITCNIDISDHPENHTQCGGCSVINLVASGIKKRIRINSVKRCKTCHADISARPKHHLMSYRCYKRKDENYIKIGYNNKKIYFCLYLL